MTWIILCILIVFTQQCSDQDTIEGHLSLFGNEPFVQLAVVTSEDERIFLDVDRQLRDSLWLNMQGRIRVKGKIYEGEWYGQSQPYIKVREWEWINPENDN